MLALLYDVHGNLHALDAVLRDARERGVRRFLVGGDVSAFGGDPHGALARLRELEPAAWIRGNHERWAAEPDAVPDAPLAVGGSSAVREDLGPADVAALHGLPTWAPLAHGGEAWHGSPRSDVETFAAGPDADPEEDALLLDGRTPTLLVCGHSHLAFRRDVRRPDGGTTVVVNPGSVGLPFDGDPRAAYAIVHDEDEPQDGVPEVELVRVAYDVEAATAAVQTTHDGRPWAAVVAATLRTGMPGGRSAADEPADSDALAAGTAEHRTADPPGDADAVEAGGAQASGDAAASLREEPGGDAADLPPLEPAATDAPAAERDPLPVLRAGGFEVVDDLGRPRARLGVQGDGAVAVDLADEDGRVRATLVVEPDGSSALKLADAHGTYRVALGAWLDGAASLDFYDRERNQRVSLGEHPGSANGLAIWGAAGRLRTLLGEGPAGDRDASLEFWDPDGAYRVGLGTWPDGATGTEMLDEHGTLRLRLGQRTEEHGPTALELYGPDGGFRVAAGEYPDGSGRVNLWDGAGASLPAEAVAPPPPPAVPEDDGPPSPERRERR